MFDYRTFNIESKIIEKFETDSGALLIKAFYKSGELKSFDVTIQQLKDFINATDKEKHFFKNINQ